MSSDLDCRPDNFKDLSEEVKKNYMNTKDIGEQQIVVVCDFKGMEDVRIKTRNITIENTIKYIKEHNTREIYRHACIMMLLHQKFVEQVFQTGGKLVDDLSDDVVIYYCARAILFNKPIPIAFWE